MQNLNPADQTALQEGRYRVDPGTAILTNRIEPEGKGLGIALALCEQGFNTDMAPMRNPGALVLLVKSRQNKPLSSADRTVVQQLATQFSSTVHSRGLPMKFGPDGRTPLVMKNVMTYSPSPENRPTEIQTILAFPSAKEAKQAAKYIDPGSYTIQMARNTLKATCIAPQGAANDEWAAFEQVAGKFGGKVESVSASIQT